MGKEESGRESVVTPGREGAGVEWSEWLQLCLVELSSVSGFGGLSPQSSEARGETGL